MLLNLSESRGCMSSAPPAAMNTGKSPLGVYVVEDSEILTKLLVSMLRTDLGVHVVGNNGEANAAIAEIRETTPDVIIVDLVLRQGNGFEVLSAIRQSNPEIVSVVLTNHSTPAYREAARKLGVEPDRFFDKTEQIGSMCNMIRAMAQQRESPA
jgi:DNA-binding NarL/FixJ family response regulator